MSGDRRRRPWVLIIVCANYTALSLIGQGKAVLEIRIVK